MRENFNNILREHGIYGEDVEEILYAVHDMLLFVADKTKKEEPYATNTINRVENAAYEIYSLASDISFE